MRTGYDALGIYHDAADRRLFVPKRNPAFGWTVNAAHPWGAPVLMLLGVVIGAALFAALRG